MDMTQDEYAETLVLIREMLDETDAAHAAAAEEGRSVLARAVLLGAAGVYLREALEQVLAILEQLPQEQWASDREEVRAVAGVVVH